MKRQLLTTIAIAAIAVPGFAGAISYAQRTDSDGGATADVILRMDVSEGTVMSPGEEMGFRFQTTEDAWILLFSIDSEGYVHLLYPIDGVQRSAARTWTDVPEAGTGSLIVSGETGMEFAFALSVPNRDWIDDNELARLGASGQSDDIPPFRIDGDPFLAANVVASQLVHGISGRNGISIAYTWFYINERVDRPCYLCGICDSRAESSDCDSFRIVADFTVGAAARYPLPRAYQLIDLANESPVAPTLADDGVDMEFYPYTPEITSISRTYVYRVEDPWYYDPWFWDPWYSGWSYAPGYGSGWGVSIGIGWGWGWGGWGWGSCYWPSYYAYGPGYYPPVGAPYGSAGYTRARFKSAYASTASGGNLTGAYRVSAKSDGALRVGSKSVRSSASVSAYRAGRSDDVSVAARGSVKGMRNRVGATRLYGNNPQRSLKSGQSSTARRPVATSPRSTRAYRGQDTERTITGTRGSKSTPPRSGITGGTSTRSGKSTGSRNVRQTPTSRSGKSAAGHSAVRGTPSSRSGKSSAPRTGVRSAPRSSSGKSAVKSGGARAGASRPGTARAGGGGKSRGGSRK